MSEATVETTASEQAVPVSEKPTENNAPAAKPSPAQDLRNIQMLLVSGIFPGNVAPQVVAAYNMLEQMAKKVEADAQAK
jgi:hypothetical protein